MHEETYGQLCQHFRSTAVFNSINCLLGWDERTKMPVEAGRFRGEQMTALAGFVHQKQTDPRVGEWLSQLEESPLVADPFSDVGANVRNLRLAYDRAVKIPQRLVEALTTAAVEGQQAWQQARAEDDFGKFAKPLQHIVNLICEKADALSDDTTAHRYDALLDEYEPGATTESVERTLVDLANRLSPLVAAIADCGRKAPAELLRRDYNVGIQARFGREVAEQIGFEFDRGRLDVTTHPFCESMGPNDCRITTRYDKNWFPGSFFGILHEAGHGIYEQGLSASQFGLPLGEYLSLGIHESQSRMWENFVGRSRPFWEHFFPKLRDAFPQPTDGVSLDDFYWAINAVQPTLIRVEADEATYNLHVVIRFELEKALVENQIAVIDLPEAWNQKYEHYLGVRPGSDAEGVLQDIHWSSAAIGYFPTYALGNLYAAQLFKKADEDLGDLSATFAQGDFQPLLTWLREHVHQQGKRYSADELVRRVTGQQLSADPLMDYLQGKLKPLFGLEA